MLRILAVLFGLLLAAPAFAQNIIEYRGPTNLATEVSAGHPLPVTSTPAGTTYTDRSGTVTSGGVAQNAMSSNTSRHGMFFQNVSNANLYINSTATASASVSAGSGSLLVVPGAYWEAPPNGVPTGALSVYGGTTGQAWVAREW